MRSQWSVPLSILAGSVIVSLGLYFGLRPAAPPMEEVRSAGDRSASTRPADPRAAESPFAERDRRRALADEELDAVRATSPPTEESRRDDPVPSEAEQAMAIASPLPSLPHPTGLAAQAEKDAADAFEAIRADVRDECWNTLPEDPAAPGSVPVDLSLSYDAEGNVLASGVSEDREARRDGLADCLGPLVHGLRIPPPGQNTSVQVRVTMP